MRLFFVAYLDITVPDKALDGNEVLFFKREVGFFQLIEKPDRTEVFQELKEAFGQRFGEHELFHE